MSLLISAWTISLPLPESTKFFVVFFKVILSPKTTPMKAIAFICPNRPCGGPLKKYMVSVDEVEKRTGMNFFNVLPDDQEERLESTCNPNQWLSR